MLKRWLPLASAYSYSGFTSFSRLLFFTFSWSKKYRKRCSSSSYRNAANPKRDALPASSRE
jgi:hypothetical protein